MKEATKAEAFYEGYVTVFQLRKAGYSLRSRQRAFEALVTQDERFNWWPIVGITAAAWESIQKNIGNGKTSNQATKGLNRSHMMSRKDRAREMFEREVPMEAREAFDFYHVNDKTVLTTSSENMAEVWSQVTDIPLEIFSNRTGMGPRLTKARYRALEILMGVRPQA
jgi:hypothetical protein